MKSDTRRYGAIVFKSLFFLVSVLWGINVGGSTQATVVHNNYQGLFWAVLGMECIHLMLAAGYFFVVRNWTRWIVVAISAISLLLLCELGLRAW